MRHDMSSFPDFWDSNSVNHWLKDELSSQFLREQIVKERVNPGYLLSAFLALIVSRASATKEEEKGRGANSGKEARSCEGPSFFWIIL